MHKECDTGHKRYDAIKAQGLQSPCGILIDVQGPYRGRRNDSFMVNDSLLNERMAIARAGK